MWINPYNNYTGWSFNCILSFTNFSMDNLGQVYDDNNNDDDDDDNNINDDDKDDNDDNDDEDTI